MTARSGSSIRRSRLLGHYEGHEGESEIGQNVHRIDGVTGKAAIVGDDVLGPDGLCFSPDARRSAASAC